MNDEERELWILNDEGLYNWYRSEHMGITSFIRKNRKELTDAIEGQ